MAKQRKKTIESQPLILATLLFVAVCLFAVPRLFAIADPKGPEASPGGNAIEEQGVSQPSLRGNIYDRTFAKLAVSFPLVSVYAKPMELRIDAERLGILAALLKSDPEELRNNLKSDRAIVWLARSLSPKVAAELGRLNLPGLYLVTDQQRYYPQAKSAAHVIGFFRDGHGLAGLEFGFDAMLAGASSKDRTQLAGQEDNSRKSLILHLDLEAQQNLEKGFRKIRDHLAAESAFGAVMNAATGEVLALANLPGYDPNRFWDYTEIDLQNKVVDEPVAPGSIGELFRLAQTVERAGENCEFGLTDLATEKQGDWQSTERGDVASPDLVALEAFVSSDAGKVDERFFALTGSPVEFPKSQGEKMVEGAEEAPLSLTAMQLLSAFSALVNGGVLRNPAYVRAFYEGEGTLSMAEQAEGATVIGPEASERLRSLLVNEKRKFCMLASLQGKSEGSDATGQAEPAAPVGDQPAKQPQLADAVVLALDEAKNGDKIMVLVLRKAVMDIDQREFLAKAVESVLKKTGAAAAGKTPEPKPAQLAVDMQQTFEKWQALQEKAAKSGASGKVGQRKRMPEVSGLSLRKALQTLDELELEITVKGAGTVVRQDPPAGSELKRKQVFLLLRSEV